MFYGLLSDVRQGLRSMSSSVAASSAIVLSLALGVGPNVLVFSAADAVLLRPLPFKNADRLVVLQGIPDGPQRDSLQAFGRARTLEQVASYRLGYANLAGGEKPEWIRVAEVSASIVPLLGIAPPIGRGFDASDEEPIGARPILLTTALWWRSFGADASIVGRALTVGGQPSVVVGVLPPNISFPDGAEIWMAQAKGQHLGLAHGVEESDRAHMGSQGLIARLAEGIQLKAARDEVIALQAQRDVEARKGRPILRAAVGVAVRELHDVITRDSRSSLFLLIGGAAFVLLIALANAAHLLLERLEVRKRDYAVRLALGAPLSRLVRQLAVEGALYALMATGLSMVMAYWGLSILRATLDSLAPIGVSLQLDTRVLAFALGASLATSLLSTLLPVCQLLSFFSANASHLDSLKGITLSRHRGALVASEIGAAVVLLVGAGLLLKSLVQQTEFTTARLGFRPEGVVTFEVDMPPSLYPGVQAEATRQRILTAIGGVPGVDSVAATSSLPYGLQSFQWVVPDRLSDTAKGNLHLQVPSDVTDGPGVLAGLYSTTPDYLRAMGVQLTAGRALSATDDHGVVVVSDDLVSHFWPEGDGLGYRIRLPGEEWPRTIVGVAKRMRTPEDDSETPVPQIYVPTLPYYGRTTTFVARTLGDPAPLLHSVRSLVAGVDPSLPPFRISTMDARVAGSFAPRRSRTILLGLFASLAVALASLGIYAVTGYSVALRTREIGIRQALGASPGDVVWLVVRQCLRQVAAGLAIGLSLAAVLSRLLVGFLYGTQGIDAQVYASVALGIGLCALVSCAWPVRSAIRVDPATALRDQ